MRKPILCMQVDIWMDEPESEWEVQVPSGVNGGNGKLGWMLKLGRKILVTGIVISSAPFYLPPLIAMSAVGLVCSVPFGIFLVSYACTESIMSRLLPMPSPAAPSLLEYGKEFNDDEEEVNGDENRGGQSQNEVINGGFSIVREEEEWKQDIIEEVERRIELVDREKGELDEGYILQEGAYQEDEIVEENRYEEEERPFQSFEIEVKEIVELNAEQPIIEEIRSEQPAVEGQEVETLVEGDEKHISKVITMDTENVEAEGELVREMRQNVENGDSRRKQKKKAKSKAKGKGKQSVDTSTNEQPKDEIHGSLTTSEGDETGKDNVNKRTFELNKVVEVEKDLFARESKRPLERNRKKGKSRDTAENKQVVEKAQADFKFEGTTDHAVADKDRVNVLGVAKQPKEVEGTTEVKEEQYTCDGSMGEQSIEEVSKVVLEFEGDEKNSSNIENETPFHIKRVDVQLIHSTNVDEDEELARETTGLLEKIRDEGKTDSAVGDKWSTDATIDKDDKKIVGDVEETKTSFLAHERMEKPTGEFETGYGNENSVDQNYLLNEVAKDVIFSNQDEKGLDLLESSSTVSQQGSPSDVNTFGEIQPSSSYSVHQEIPDSSDLPVSTKVQESDDVRFSAENVINTASSETLCSENIWEQINALRTIVGYKAERQETCVDELKALYLFTGIMPPASFKDISDLAEINAKLRFLKSVVGVK